jgi:hypothetical protein
MTTPDREPDPPMCATGMSVVLNRRLTTYEQAGASPAEADGGYLPHLPRAVGLWKSWMPSARTM